MYNLLIVDDERIVVDGLYDTIKETEDLNLELYKAYSGMDALSILDTIRIDIIVTDILMPDINGFALQEHILKKFPRIKVIFLTGFDDFNFAKAAIRNNSIDYILKVEGDEVIFDAIKKAILKLVEEEKNEEMINNVKKEYQRYIPNLQKQLFMEMISGSSILENERIDHFERLMIPLDPRLPFIMLLGHVDNIQYYSDMGRKLSIILSVQNIFNEYFKDIFTVLPITADNFNLIWFIQPKMPMQENAGEMSIGIMESNIKYIYNSLDLIQNSCREIVCVTISFVMGKDPCQWDTLSGEYNDLEMVFLKMITEGSKEIIISDYYGDANNNRDKYIHLKNKIKQTESITSFFENGKMDELNNFIGQIMDELSTLKSIPFGLASEVYYSIGVKYLTFINKMDIAADIAAKFDFDKLMNLKAHNSWHEIKSYFIELNNIIFNIGKANYNIKVSTIKDKINDYIDSNLDKDLSVGFLARLVHLNQSYLSRLYKSSTGKSLSEYITERKLEKARYLLKQSDMKINEIASALGFSSHAYFTQFFKKYLNVSPQQFKDLS